MPLPLEQLCPVVCRYQIGGMRWSIGLPRSFSSLSSFSFLSLRSSEMRFYRSSEKKTFSAQNIHDRRAKIVCSKRIVGFIFAHPPQDLKKKKCFCCRPAQHYTEYHMFYSRFRQTHSRPMVSLVVLFFFFLKNPVCFLGARLSGRPLYTIYPGTAVRT